MVTSCILVRVNVLANDIPGSIPAYRGMEPPPDGLGSVLIIYVVHLVQADSCPSQDNQCPVGSGPVYTLVTIWTGVINVNSCKTGLKTLAECICLLE